MSHEIDARVIQATQEVLSKHIKKPSLTEKLLRKPPFRFLHDLVTNVIRETGFLKGLYSERELVSENVKDKEDKIAFLNKLIEAIKTITEQDLVVKPSKIISGFEPHNTNLLLQAIGMALDKKLDSTKYINDLKSQKLGKNKENVKESKQKISKSKEKILKENEKHTKVSKSHSNQSMTPKQINTKLDKKRSTSKDSKTGLLSDKKLKQKSDIPAKQKSIENADNDKILESESINNVQSEDSILHVGTLKDDRILSDSDLKSSQTSLKELEINMDYIKPHLSNIDLSTKKNFFDEAKEKSDEGDELIPPLNKVDKTDNKKENIENAIKNYNEPEVESSHIAEKNISKQLTRPKSSVRPVSVRPLSSRPGAPRLQKNDIMLIKDKEIVPLGKVDVIDEQSTNDFADEEETVTIEASEVELQAAPLEVPTDKGHLVEQIMQQIHDSDIEGTKSNINVEWEQAGLRNRQSTMKELEQLQDAIQDLTKMVNPLGKLTNYLHEDIEAMHSELDMWNNHLRQTMVEITSQKKITDESNMPLQIKLDEIEESIFKHQQQIITTNSNIIRNEERIQDLLLK